MAIGLGTLFVCIKYRGAASGPPVPPRKRVPTGGPHAAPGTGVSYMKLTVAPVAQARTGIFTFWPIFSE